MSAKALDASTYMHGSTEDRVQFARTFVTSLSKDGYAKLRNHGISHEDVKEMLTWVCEISFLSSLTFFIITGPLSAGVLRADV